MEARVMRACEYTSEYKKMSLPLPPFDEVYDPDFSRPKIQDLQHTVGGFGGVGPVDDDPASKPAKAKAYLELALEASHAYDYEYLGETVAKHLRREKRGPGEKPVTVAELEHAERYINALCTAYGTIATYADSVSLDMKDGQAG